MPRRRILLLAALCGCFSVPSLAQDAPQLRVRGTIDSVNGTSMVVTTRDGTKQTLAMAPNVGVTAIIAIKISDIRPHSYIGTAAVPQADGTLLAREIQVFPESMRGVGEGHRPWDLEPNSTMTNGTVGDVAGTSGRTLTVTYKGGEQKVVVPENAPIITYAPAGRDMLVAGAHVIITATRQPDGSLVATRIGVGKDGLVPPM